MSTSFEQLVRHISLIISFVHTFISYVCRRKTCNPTQLTTDGQVLYGPQAYLDVWARNATLLLHSWASRSLPGYTLKVDARVLLSAISLTTSSGEELRTTDWPHAPGVDDVAIQERLDEIEDFLKKVGIFTPQAHKSGRINKTEMRGMLYSHHSRPSLIICTYR